MLSCRLQACVSSLGLELPANEIWLELPVGGSDFSAVCLDSSVGCLGLSAWCLDLSMEWLDLSAGCASLSAGHEPNKADGHWTVDAPICKPGLQGQSNAKEAEP